MVKRQLAELGKPRSSVSSSGFPSGLDQEGWGHLCPAPSAMRGSPFKGGWGPAQQLPGDRLGEDALAQLHLGWAWQSSPGVRSQVSAPRGVPAPRAGDPECGAADQGPLCGADQPPWTWAGAWWASRALGRGRKCTPFVLPSERIKSWSSLVV